MPASTEAPATEPRRSTVFVGVIGHRPPGLDKADPAGLRGAIRSSLETVREVCARLHGAAPVMIVVSPLAEGADRVAAEQALSLGFELYAPLPFARNEYERDFMTVGSQLEFHRLLAQAERVLELQGSRRDPKAYTAVGHAVLDRSDVVLVVWDGREARGDGGTGQMVLEAIHRRLPTIWVRAAAPHDVSLLSEDPRHGGTREEPLSHLAAALQRMRR